MKTDAVPDYLRERAIFPGTIPTEVKIFIKNVSSINKSFFRKLIKVALGYLQQTLLPDQCEAAFQNLCESKGCANEKDVMELSIQYAGVISLLRAVLKVNLKTVRQDTLTSDLIELGLPGEYATDICKVVFGPAHADIFQELILHNPHHPKIEHMDWKVEVTLSNSWSTKVLEPNISFTMKTSDEKIHNFEVPISSFHILRQSTAIILRHMELLQRKK